MTPYAVVGVESEEGEKVPQGFFPHFQLKNAILNFEFLTKKLTILFHQNYLQHAPLPNCKYKRIIN
jgi:hypothetical protein